MICRANQWTDFYMTTASVLKELNICWENGHFLQWFMKYVQKQPFADVLQIGVRKNLAVFTGKHLCCSIFLIKLLAFRLVTFLKIDYSIGAFLWILSNFLWNTSGHAVAFASVRISHGFRSNLLYFLSFGQHFPKFV